MLSSDPSLHPGNNTSSREILPFGASTDDNLPSFSSILGADEDDTIGLSPDAVSRKIGAINEFYRGMEAPYISAEALIRKSLSEKQMKFSQFRADQNQLTAAEREIEDLRDGLRWALKKVNVLEEERKTLISGLH